MGLPDCEIEAASIVILGSFNPAIWHPGWLAKHNLIRPEEAEKAASQVLVTEDVAIVEIDWLRVNCSRNTLQLSTRDPAHYPPLRDLGIGALALLHHTPVRALGINKEMHFPLGSEEKYREFGSRLAPRAPWASVMDEPALLVIRMKGKSPENGANSLQVTLTPSEPVKNGIFINTNSHFDLDEDSGAVQLVEILREHWQSALAEADRCARTILAEELDRDAD